MKRSRVKRKERLHHGGILHLLCAAMALVLGVLFSVEWVFLALYRTNVEESLQMLSQTWADEVYNEMNRMWYQLNLISGTFSRSEAMRAYLHADVGDRQAAQSLRSSVYMTLLASSNIDAVIVTDFGEVELFAYGEQNARAIHSARRALENGLIVKNPVHLQEGTGSDALLYCINCTDTLENGSMLYTIIVYNIDEVYSRFAEIADEGSEINLVLLDGNGIPLLEVTALEGEARRAAEEALREGGVPEGTRFFQSRTLSLLRWRLTTFVREETLRSRMGVIGQFAGIVAGSALVIWMIFFAFLYKQITAPIHQILEFMQRQSTAAEAEVLVMNTRNELGQIADGLNEMLRIQRNMAQENIRDKERIYEAELARKRSEIAVLTHQINPHFLYNTLDCMYGMALARGMDDLGEIISSMAHIFRYAARSSAYVSVSEEIESIRRYMSIVRIRHAGRIDVEYALAEETLPLRIPRMILQPIVENAVTHGMEMVRRNTTVRLRTWLQESDLYISVSDDGTGIEAGRLAQLQCGLASAQSELEDQREHIGMVNIHRRLRLLYGPEYGLTLESQEDRGTTVTLRLRADGSMIPGEGRSLPGDGERRTEHVSSNSD